MAWGTTHKSGGFVSKKAKIRTIVTKAKHPRAIPRIVLLALESEKNKNRDSNHWFPRNDGLKRTMTTTLSNRSAQEEKAAQQTAKILLDIGAVNFRPEEPYILTSGRASPVYIDCRKIISFPKERDLIIDHAVDALATTGSDKSLDSVAGGETAGIPYAAWIASKMNLPMLYVRKQPKGFGRMAQIEGDMAKGSHTALIEDLATDGGSKINFINAIREAGSTVDRVFVVFYYGIFPEALNVLEGLGVKLVWLAVWADVVKAAEEGNYFSPEKIAAVRAFLDDPHGWSAAHGGKAD